MGSIWETHENPRNNPVLFAPQVQRSLGSPLRAGLVKDTQIILKDMKETKCGQSSWDWPADYRFAKAISAKDEIEILEMLLKSTTVFAIQIACHRKFITKLKNRRLRALKILEKQGIIRSGWLGTGPGGLKEFGTRRVKSWHLDI